MDNAIPHVVATIQEICEQPVPEDGLRFAAETVVGEQIIEAADYEGVRVRFAAYLGTARIPMQVDIDFGDPVAPGPFGIHGGQVICADGRYVYMRAPANPRTTRSATIR